MSYITQLIRHHSKARVKTADVVDQETTLIRSLFDVDAVFVQLSQQ